MSVYVCCVGGYVLLPARVRLFPTEWNFITENTLDTFLNINLSLFLGKKRHSRIFFFITSAWEIVRFLKVKCIKISNQESFTFLCYSIAIVFKVIISLFLLVSLCDITSMKDLRKIIDLRKVLDFMLCSAFL